MHIDFRNICLVNFMNLYNIEGNKYKLLIGNTKMMLNIILGQ